MNPTSDAIFCRSLRREVRGRQDDVSAREATRVRAEQRVPDHGDARVLVDRRVVTRRVARHVDGGEPVDLVAVAEPAVRLRVDLRTVGDPRLYVVPPGEPREAPGVVGVAVSEQ